MTTALLASGAVLVIWYQLHRIYLADLATAKAVINDRAEERVERVKEWALEATQLAQEVVDNATVVAENAIADVTEARRALVELAAENERLRAAGSVVVPFRRGGVA